MDWRLIAAVSAAAGSFCFVVVGAYVVLTHNPAPQPTFASAPMLLSEYRFPTATAPSLMSAQPTSPSSFAPSSFAPSSFAPSPFAPQGNSAPVLAAVTSGAAVAPGRLGASAASVNPPRVAEDFNKSSPGHSEPKQEPRAVGYKTAALTPYDAASRPEPPARPVVEVRKSSVVPELHTALPTSRYRGVLTSAEIARIKYNLRLTPDQERAWPSVEAALAEMGRQQIALIRHGQEPRISPNEWPPGRLYAAAGPLLQTLRPEQKETVRRLCRSLGFESVASML
jgi:hypothetical protein